MENNIKEIDNNPKIITKFEPLIWLAFIALTAVVGCPVFQKYFKIAKMLIPVNIITLCKWTNLTHPIKQVKNFY